MNTLIKLKKFIILFTTFILLINELSPAKVEAATDSKLGMTNLDNTTKEFNDSMKSKSAEAKASPQSGVVQDKGTPVATIAPPDTSAQEITDVKTFFPAFSEYEADYYVTMVAYLLQIILAVIGVEITIFWKGEISSYASTIIYVIGSIVFLATEIASAASYKAINTIALTEFIKKKDVDMQIESLKTLKRTIETYKDFVIIKVVLLSGVVAADFLASGIAGIEFITCIIRGIGNKGAGGGVGIAAAIAAAIAECTKPDSSTTKPPGADELLIDNFHKQKTDSFNSMLAFTISELVKIIIKNAHAAPTATSGNGLTIDIVSILSGALLGTITGGAGGLAIYGILKIGAKKILEFQLMSAATRAIFYAIAGIGASVALGLTSAKISILMDRISEIDQIIMKLEMSKIPPLPNFTPPSFNFNPNIPNLPNMPKLPSLTVQVEAPMNNMSFAGSGSVPCTNMSVMPPKTDSSCECKKSTSCSYKVPNEMKPIGNFINAPEATTAFNSMKSMADSISYGDMKGASSAARSAYQNALKLRKEFNEMKNKHNEMLAKAKIKPFDPMAEGRKQFKDLIDQSKSALKTAGITDAQMKELAKEFGINTSNRLKAKKDSNADLKDNNNSSSTANEANAKDENKSDKSDDKSKGENKDNLNNKKKKSDEEDDEDWNEDGDEEEDGVDWDDYSKFLNSEIKIDEAANPTTTDEKAEDEQNLRALKGQKIGHKRRESIFKMLSDRYKKSAYPVFFVKKKK
ncbi:MAG: hypothetical protein HQK49_12295 [Oligoflexia bacterium]|nr:hypothetical protein [Oligoflexia bacterium]